MGGAEHTKAGVLDGEPPRAYRGAGDRGQAAFDFLAGTKRQAPVWMQRNGLEWLFRLCSEPRRLCGRYAYTVPGFVILAAGEFVRRAIARVRLA